MFLLHRSDDKSRSLPLRCNRRIEPRVFAVYHPVNLRLWRTACATMKLESVAFICERNFRRFNNARHLKHVQSHRVNFDRIFAIVQSADVSSLIVSMHVCDFKSVAVHGYSRALKLQGSVGSTPSCLRCWIGDPRAFEENFFARFGWEYCRRFQKEAEIFKAWLLKVDPGILRFLRWGASRRWSDCDGVSLRHFYLSSCHCVRRRTAVNTGISRRNVLHDVAADFTLNLIGRWQQHVVPAETKLFAISQEIFHTSKLTCNNSTRGRALKQHRHTEWWDCSSVKSSNASAVYSLLCCRVTLTQDEVSLIWKRVLMNRTTQRIGSRRLSFDSQTRGASTVGLL